MGNTPDLADMLWLFTSDSTSRGLARLNIGEAGLLWRYAKQARFGIVEIGRYRGGSTCLLAGANAHVPITSVENDPTRENENCSNYLNTRGVERLVADSRTVRYNHFYDLAFIDGDHSYEGVAADYMNLLPNLMTKAVVAFHDAVEGADGTCAGVTKFVRELIAAGQLESLELADSLWVCRRR